MAPTFTDALLDGVDDAVEIDEGVEREDVRADWVAGDSLQFQHVDRRRHADGEHRDAGVVRSIRRIDRQLLVARLAVGHDNADPGVAVALRTRAVRFGEADVDHRVESEVGVRSAGHVDDSVDGRQHLRFVVVRVQVEVELDIRAEADDADADRIQSDFESVNDLLNEVLHQQEVIGADAAGAVEQED